eukprot:jgi/Botrbrau1/11656/Bobra.168_2s0013.1
MASSCLSHHSIGRDLYSCSFLPASRSKLWHNYCICYTGYSVSSAVHRGTRAGRRAGGKVYSKPRSPSSRDLLQKQGASLTGGTADTTSSGGTLPRRGRRRRAQGKPAGTIHHRTPEQAARAGINSGPNQAPRAGTAGLGPGTLSAVFSVVCEPYSVSSISNSLPVLGALHRDEAMEPEPFLVVFSGGTAFNSIAGQLRNLTTRVAYVLPVSDDGGSTAEIVRVLGGPAVGDIRSRCLRLADDSDDEAQAVKKLLAYRLPEHSARAKAEWFQIVEGDHELWQGVSSKYKVLIRRFLVHFHSEILHLPSPNFSFRNGSVGNFFFAGLRLMFGSLETSVFLFSRVARIPHGSLVLPAIETNERITLAAQLADGSIIRGQNTISHPSSGGGSPGPTQVDKKSRLRQPLPSPVSRIFYMSSEGTQREHEVQPDPNPEMLDAVTKADAIVYGMGSLYTSICPALVLKGVGEAMAARRVPKIFLLNGSHDRETSACRGRPGAPMQASDCVTAVCDTLNRCESHGGALHHPVTSYVTAVLVPTGSSIEVAVGPAQ